MKNLISIIFFVIRTFIGEGIATAYQIMHLTRGAVITFHFGIDWVNITIYVVVGIFITLLHIWQKREFTGKTKIVFHGLIIILHVITVVIIYVEKMILQHNVIGCIASIIGYMLFEAAYHIYDDMKATKVK